MKKIRAKLIIDIETNFEDDISSDETLRFTVDEDLKDKGYNVVSTELVNGVENSTDQALNLPVVMPSVYGIFRHESYKVYGFYWSLEVAEEICNERDGEDWYVDELCIDQH